MAAKIPARDLTAEVAYLTRTLKATTLRESVPRLAERARHRLRVHTARHTVARLAARVSHNGWREEDV